MAARPMKKKNGATVLMEKLRDAHRIKVGDVAFDGFVEMPTGMVYAYTGTYWKEISNETIDGRLFSLEPDAKLAKIREARELLKTAVHDEGFKFGRVADHEVPCLNGVVNVLTGAIRAHRPSDCIDSVIPWAYDPTATCPIWIDTLGEWFGDGDGAGEAITALQDFFGYIVLPHAKYKKAIILLGPSNSGKSIPAHIARVLVGDDATCSISVEAMDDPVALWAIKHKRLNVITELSAEAMIRDGGFKKLVSTEEPIFINGKWEKPMMYIPPTKHMVVTNKLPRVTDRTEATINRMLIVPFDRVYLSHEQDENRVAKLTTPAAMTGFLAWAILGAKRLVERGGKWVQPEAGVTHLAELREESNPMIAFAREKLYPDMRCGMSAMELATMLNEWVGKKGRYSTRDVGKMARSAGMEWGVVTVSKGLPLEGAVRPGAAKGLRGWRPREGNEFEEPRDGT